MVTNGLRVAARLLSCAALAWFAVSVTDAARAQTPAPIKIGLVTELSGSWSFFGASCSLGAKQAEQEINAAGGVLGRPIELKIVDDRTSPAEALAAVRRLDQQDNVLAITGPTNSDNILAIYGYVEQNKLPFIVDAATPQVTKPGTHYTFRLYPTDNVGVGVAVSKLIAKLKPAARVALMYADYSYPRTVMSGLKYQAAKSGLNIVSDTLFPQGSSDATVQVAQVAASKPDYIVVLGVGALDNTITQQLLDFGLKPGQIVHPYGLPSSIVNWGPKSVGSIYGTILDVNQTLTPAGQAMAKKFAEESGRIPDYTTFYCDFSVHVLKEAIEKAGAADRAKLRDALASMTFTEPATGATFGFDSNGARKVSQITFMKITDVAGKTYKAQEVQKIEWNTSDIPAQDLAK